MVTAVVGVAGTGRIQRELLGVMRRNGGCWPTGWRLCVPERRVMESLMRRGLVTHRDGVYRLVAA